MTTTTMLDATASGGVDVVRDLQAEIIAAFLDPTLELRETVLVVPTKKKRPKRLASNKVDGLLMLEPEELQKMGECPGGRYFYVTNCDTAVRHLEYWARQRAWAAIDLETGCCRRTKEVIQQRESVDPATGERYVEEIVAQVPQYYDLADPYNSPIFLASISVEPGVAFVFDMRTLMQEDLFNEAFRTFLTQCGLVCHGSIFEQSFFMARWGVTANIVYDTMLVHQLMTAGLDRGSDLGSMMKKYEGIELDKQWQKFFLKIHPESPIPNEAIAYSAGDVCRLLSMMQKVDAELRKDPDLYRVWVELEKPLMEWMAVARVEGLAVDREKLFELRDQFSGAMEEEKAKFDALCPSTLISSNQQLKAWFEMNGVFTDNVDEAALERIAKKWDGQTPAEVARIVLAYRKVAKFVSTYVNPFLEEHVSPVSGRVHPFWKQLNTHTGRMACLTGDTPVCTSAGIVPLSSVRAGDSILTPLGYRAVLKSWENGSRAVFKVTLSDGRIVRATGDHPFLSDDLTYRPLSEFRVGDRVFLSTVAASAGSAPTLPTIRRWHQQKKEVVVPDLLDAETAFIIGWFVAEGCFDRSTYRLLFSFDANSEREIANRIAAWIQARGLKPAIVVNGNSGQVVATSIALFKWFAEICNGEALSRHRSTPPLMWTASPQLRSAYLCSLMSGDGGIHARRGRYGNQLRFTTYSEQLARETQTLALTLGVPLYLAARKAASGKYEKWVLTLPAHYLERFANSIGFVGGKAIVLEEQLRNRELQEKRWDKTPNRSTDQWLKRILSARCLFPVEIRSIESCGQENVFDLTVAEEHCFLANGVVVHNCGEPNIQNIPRDEPWVQFRGAIVAPPGYKLIYRDYSQYEVRCLADLANEPKMLAVFRERAELLPSFERRCKELGLPGPDALTELREKKPEKYEELVGPYPDVDELAARLADLDFHRRTASLLFKVPVTEVTKAQRSKAKTITFALPYGAGPPGVAQQAGISVEEAEQLINDYYASFPAVKNYLERMRQQARRGYTATPSGRKRLYPRPDRDRIYREALEAKQAGGKAWEALRARWKSDDPARIALKRVEYQLAGIEREGTNHPIQGCNADATKLATVLAAPRLRWLDPRCKIVAWVHDEIIMIAPEEAAEAADQILERAMLEAASRYLTRCPVEVSVVIADRWGK